MQKSKSRKVDKHGLVISGLKKASGSIVNWPSGSGGYTEVFYNVRTGEVWTKDQVGLGHSNRTVYDDKDIIKICEPESHMTMQQIADAIFEVVTYGRR